MVRVALPYATVDLHVEPLRDLASVSILFIRQAHRRCEAVP